MSLAKNAQYDMDTNPGYNFTEIMNVEDEPEIQTEISIAVDEDGDGQIDDDEIITFELPNVPGGISQDDLSELVVDEPESEDIVVEERDMWNWGTLSNFVKWLHGMINNVPKHSGHDTAGLERAIAFLQNLDRSISKAVRSDLKDELDVAKIESARDEIIKGIERLEERLDRINSNKRKRNKKASEAAGFTKEAQKITGVHGVIVTVPLLISRLARICVNGSVSGGHDIEDIFDRLSKKYKLTDREEAELMQLLEDMGYPIRRDRGFNVDEQIDERSSDNFDWQANYHA